MAKLTAGTTKTASKKEKRNRTLHETSSFQYGVSSLNLTKSTVNCRKSNMENNPWEVPAKQNENIAIIRTLRKAATSSN